jgi:hypothetical protein
MIYESKRQPALYFVTLVTLSLSVFVSWMIFSAGDDFNREFSSPSSALAWKVIFLLGGNIMLLCMVWLNGRYVLEITKAEDEIVSVKTWSILGLHRTRRYPRSILTEGCKFHSGQAWIDTGPRVNAPWLRLRTPEGRLLVVDAQGSFAEEWSAPPRRGKC